MSVVFGTIGVGILLGLFLTPVFRWAARRVGILRQSEGGPAAGSGTVPAVGGPVVLAVTGTLVVALEWCGAVPPLAGADRGGGFAAAVVMCLVGVVDDWRGLRGRWKLLGQVFAVGIAVAAGISINEIQLFGWHLSFGPVRWLVTGVALLVAANSLLVLRGMDALVSSYGMIVAAALGVIGVVNGHQGSAVFALGLSGALCAFLIKSFPPAAVLMGSSGAMTSGFLIGVVAVAGSAKTQAAAMLAVPAALLTLPLFDGAATVFRRSLSRHGLYAPDQGQLYHRLLRIGFSRRRILAVVCVAALVTAAGAILSQFYKREIFALVAGCTIVAVLLATRLFGNVRLSWGGHKVRTARLLCSGRESLEDAFGTDGPPYPTSEVPESAVAWPEFWAQVVAAAPVLRLRHARLKVAAQSNGEPNFDADWVEPAAAPKGQEVWRAEFALADVPCGPFGRRRVGRLEVVGVNDGVPELATLGRLAELVPDLRRVAELRPAGRPADNGGPRPRATRDRIHLIETVTVDDLVRSYRAGVVDLRVCHLGKFYPPAAGGIENHVRTLAQAQARLGAAVRVICVNHESAAGADSTWKGLGATPTVEEQDGPVRVTRVGKVATLARLDVCPKLVGVLRRLMDDAPHVVHLHTPNPTMLMAYALACPSLPLVVTHHSDVVRQRLLSYALAPFRRIVYTRARRVLTTSPLYAAGSREVGPYGPKLDSLVLGSDLTPFQRPTDAALECARALKARYPGPLWLGVGRLTYYKGFDVALEALARAPGTLMIIGTGPLDADLRERAARLGVADRVVWRGYVTPDELAGAYQAATGLWFSSNARSEGFGLVQVEAMASGCPVINTAIPDSGVTFVSPDEETGLTVPVNDPEAFATAARRLLNEPGLRGRLGRAGRARAAAEFDHLVMARRSLDIYSDILGQANVEATDLSAVEVATA
jgi:rhamnosyl/mannosyltransferase